MTIKDHRTSPLIIAFWSFFTGLQLDSGLEKLKSSHGKREILLPFILAFVCAFGVAISLWRTMRTSPKQ
jgi:hypothetical protein